MKHEPMIQRYALDSDETPSEGVYSVIAAMEDASPLDLPPLAETADPDALNGLLTGGAETNEVSFRYCGYELSATADEIRVQELDTE